MDAGTERRRQSRFAQDCCSEPPQRPASIEGGRTSAQQTRYDVAMDERDFYTERPESKPAEYVCPRCKRSNQYQVRWVRRTKKTRLPPSADERDRALYAKLRDYLIRVDDDVTCKTCQKRFEIPSHQTMVFLDERSSTSTQGNDEDDDNRGNRA